MADRVRVVVVGGGVIGCAILYELAARGIEAVLVESQPDVCEGTSKASSAIVHTGFDSKPGSLESRMLRRAAGLWPDLVDALGVPFLEVGALMIARTADDAARLGSGVAANAGALGVATALLDRAAVHDAAPYLAEDVVAALSIPGEAVIDPFWLTRALAEAAILAGASLRLGSPVAGLAVDADCVDVLLADGTRIRADQVIDAAGVHADQVAALAGQPGFAITPRRGQFLVSEETFGVDRIVLPIPGPMGKGMLVTPIVFGGLLLGPTAVDQDDKDDRSTDAQECDRILASVRSMVPALAGAAPVRAFAGVRHVSSTGDFILRPSGAGDRLYLAAGIRSTGVSTSPAVAETVVDDVVALRGWSATGRRRLVAPGLELPEEAGEVVCVCRSISRGEVEAACRRPTQPRTLDAVKRRGGAMFGDCQGNMCALDVGRIVAAERGVKLTDVVKGRTGSGMWRPAPVTPHGRAGEDAAGTARPGAAARAGGGGPWDVAVVGGGRAGVAAAQAVDAAGRSVVMFERRDCTSIAGNPAGRPDATVVGLSPDDGGWTLLVQTPAGTEEVRAGAVVLASGGFVQPREQRRIAGPRPAGVMTGDLCRRLLAEGLVPGVRVVLVGAARRTRALAADLRESGAEVTVLAEEPAELRGEPRIEAVRSGSEWLACDALVLDDRLVPQAFLLRGLGLLDARAGTRLEVAQDGRLAPPGLWAAGCCVEPDPDHAGCAAAGREVGRRAADSVRGLPDGRAER